MYVFTERPRSEISRGDLNSILDRFFESPFHSSYPERATIASEVLGLEIPLARVMANHIPKIVEKLKPILIDDSSEEMQEALKWFALYLKTLVGDESFGTKFLLEKIMTGFGDKVETEKYQEILMRLAGDIVVEYFDGRRFGLEEMLENRDKMPIIDLERTEFPVHDLKPLLKHLESKSYVPQVVAENDSALNIVLTGKSRKDDEHRYELKILVSDIPVSSLRHVTGSKWVKLGLTIIEELFEMAQEHGAPYQQKYSSIFSAIKKLEDEHNLIVRGDGTVFRKN